MLAIGLVVDDAIVMLENIFRHVEEGKSPREAAFIGSKRDRLRRHRDDADAGRGLRADRLHGGRDRPAVHRVRLTLAGAVLVSGFVALTLTPMMCSKLLRTRRKHGRIYNVIEWFLRGLTRGYRGTLRLALRVRPLVILIGLCVAGVELFLRSSC